MRIALTGTPGTGKSTLAAELAREGFRVCYLYQLARESKALLSYDEVRNAREVDLRRLAGVLPSDPSLLLVGHLAHLLPMEVAIVLRCHPDILRCRLKQREWKPPKVKENLEAEAVGVIVVEALERMETYEVDTSTARPEETVRSVLDIIQGKGASYLAPWVDWSEVILSWY